jgi:hypothetical protein
VTADGKGLGASLWRERERQWMGLGAAGFAHVKALRPCCDDVAGGVLAARAVYAR